MIYDVPVNTEVKKIRSMNNVVIISIGQCSLLHFLVWEKGAEVGGGVGMGVGVSTLFRIKTWMQRKSTQHIPSL